MKLGKHIGILAKDKGICEGHLKKIMGFTQAKQLVDMYFSGSDWAFKNDFPSVEIMRTYKGMVEPLNMLVDAEKTLHNPRRVGIFGNSNITIEVDGFQVSEIYVRHNSNLQIIAKGDVKVFVTQGDNATVNVVKEGNAVVKIFKR